MFWSEHLKDISLWLKTKNKIKIKTQSIKVKDLEMKKKKSEFHQEAWEMYIQTGAVSQIQFAFQLKKKKLEFKETNVNFCTQNTSL